MFNQRFLLIGGLVLAGALTGCQTPRATRIEQHQSLYSSLDPLSQRLVRQGMVNLGFTSEVVYLALGQPNEVETRQTPDGEMLVWTYRNYLIGDKTSDVPRFSDIQGVNPFMGTLSVEMVGGVVVAAAVAP
ncbi:MAG: hypothetical protein U1F61_29730 [Opitutaceae bacterium]